MGVYSEMDADRRYGHEEAFETEDDCCAFETEEKSAFEDCCEPQAPVTAPPPSAAPMPTASQSTPSATPVQAKEESSEEDEAAKRKAHEEAEAKRKAEWEAAQAAKKAAEQEQLAKLSTMSEDELLQASIQRVSADTEKLTRRNMKECVAEHIQMMCYEDIEFARKVLHPKKSTIHCIWYINRKAQEYAEQELKNNAMRPDRGGIYGTDIPDDIVYQWAVDYYNDPNAKEDQEEEEKFVPKPYPGKSAPKSKGKSQPKKAATPPKAEKKPEPKKSEGEQITLGDFGLLEKAG